MLVPGSSEKISEISESSEISEFGEGRTQGEELLERVRWIAMREHRATRDLLRALGEIEAASLHLTAGYNSLFAFCTIALGYSEGAALRRIKAARCVRRFPQTWTMLQQGKLNLSTLCLLAEALTKDNAAELLAAAAGQNTREVERIVARYRPEQRSRFFDRVRSVFTWKLGKKAAEDGEEEIGRKKSYFEQIAEKFKPHLPNHLRNDFDWEKIELANFNFYAKPDLVQKVKRMRELLSGKCGPGAKLEQVFAEAIDCYIRHNCPVEKARRIMARKAEKRERSLKKKDAAEQLSARLSSWHIPTEVRFEVLLRDNFHCTYVGPDGTRCGNRYQVEVDHIQPFAAGGTHDPENLRVLCRPHNQMMAERFFGKGLWHSVVGSTPHFMGLTLGIFLLPKILVGAWPTSWGRPLSLTGIRL